MLDANKELNKWDWSSRSEIVEAMNEFAQQVAIYFHDWQKKDQAECLAEMSTEDYFDKYFKSKQ